MNYVEQKLFFNELKYEAVSKVLNDLDSTVEEQLHRTFEDLYLNLISKETRANIDKRIADAEAAEQAAAEAGRRFAVYHLHDGSDDYHFVDELRNTFMSAAAVYRGMVSDGVLNHTVDSIAHECFGEHQPIDALTFMVLCDAKEHDERINAVIEFDFDAGKVSVSEGRNTEWNVHSLSDVASAVDIAFKGNEKMFLFERNKRFEDALNRIESSSNTENLDENTGIAPQM
ncbi:MAG: hypothetical protein IKT38_03595 [Clostridia bacterium]|nr:hypothetical protein [Clostridia bacterium]